MSPGAKSAIWVLITLFSIISICCNSNYKSKHTDKYTLDSIAVLYHLGKLDSCIILAKDFNEKNPKSDKVLHLLSSAYLKRNEDSLAELYAMKALELNSRNHIALLNLGIICDKKKQNERAARYYEKSIFADSSFAQAFSNFAGNRLLVGDYVSAINYGEKAVKLGCRIEDEAILCVSYHKNNNFHKRDSIYRLLVIQEYKHLTSIESLIFD